MYSYYNFEGDQNYLNMKKNVYLLIVFIMILYSCSDEPLLNDVNSFENKEFIIANGMLNFKDQNAFSKQVDHLHKMSKEEREHWLQDINFNNSLYTKTKDLSSEEFINAKMVDVPDEIFATLLNDKGEFAIGEEIHRITQNKELVMSKSSFSKNAGNWDDGNAVSKFDVYYGENDYARKDVPYTVYPYDGDFALESNPSEIANLEVDHLRAKIIGWNRGYIAYASVGIKISGKKKRRRKFKNDKMWYAAFRYDATVHGDFGAVREKEGFKEGRHEKDVQETIFWKTGGRYSFVRMSASFIYEDDGHPRVVSIGRYSFNF